MAILSLSYNGKPTKSLAAPATAAARGITAVTPQLAELQKLTLPMEVTPVKGALTDAHILIHGEKKIGKTTLANAYGTSFILEFDPLQNWIQARQRFVPTWLHFMQYLQLLEQHAARGKLPFNRVIIDGADIWYRLCQKWVEKSLQIEHLSDADWGKGWDKIKETFSDACRRLMALGCGTWYICHSQWKEVQSRIPGRKVTKLMPQLKGGGDEILTGLVDAWFAYDYWEQQRILIVQGDERTAAGHRMDGHFLTPGKQPVQEIWMGNSPAEAWNNLQAAFDNQQDYIRLADIMEHEERRELRPERGLPKLPPQKGGSRGTAMK